MWEWAAQAVLAAAGLSAGVATAAGLFSFIVELGVVADFADRTHTAEHILFYEDCVALGALWGIFCMCFISEYLWGRPFSLHSELLPGFSRAAGPWRWRDTQCVSHIYAEGEGGQISECVYHKHGSWKRLGSFSLFLPQMVRKCAYDMKIIWGRCDSHESHLPLKL